MIPDNKILFEISEQDLIAAVTKAMQIDFVDNLRQRATFVKLDSKIRGCLGEIGMNRFLTENGIDIIGTDTYEKENGEDKDILVRNRYGQFVIEVKTSLIPDKWRTLNEVMKNADIKIIKRENDYHDIKADFHAQIYFNQWRKQRDTYLKSLFGSPADYSVCQIIDIMKLKELRQVFVAWRSKKDLIAYLDTQKVKTWHYSYRYFWRCPLAESKEPRLLADAVKEYK